VVRASDLQLTVVSSNPCNMAIFRFFQDAAAVRHLGFVMRVLGPSTKDIWWYITMQNLVGIAVVVLKICEFQYYASLALKCLFANDVSHRPNPQKDRPWAEPRHLSYEAGISVERFELGVGTRKKEGQDRKSHKMVIFHLFVEKHLLKRCT